MINDPLLPRQGRAEIPPPPPGADESGSGVRRLAPRAARQKHPAMSARILATGISIASVITMTSNYTQAQKADEAAKAAAKAAADAAAQAAADAAATQAAAAQAAAQAAADAAAQSAGSNQGVVVDGNGGTTATPAPQAPVVITVPPAPATPGPAAGSPSTNQRSSGSN